MPVEQIVIQSFKSDIAKLLYLHLQYSRVIRKERSWAIDLHSVARCLGAVWDQSWRAKERLEFALSELEDCRIAKSTFKKNEVIFEFIYGRGEVPRRHQPNSATAGEKKQTINYSAPNFKTQSWLQEISNASDSVQLSTIASRYKYSPSLDETDKQILSKAVSAKRHGLASGFSPER